MTIGMTIWFCLGVWAAVRVGKRNDPVSFVDHLGNILSMLTLFLLGPLGLIIAFVAYPPENI